MDKPEFQMTENTGKKIKAWCGSAESTPKIRLSLQQCDTIQELTQLYQELGDEAVLNQGAFTQRKNELLTLSQNGTFK